MSTEPLYEQWKKQVKSEGRAEGRMEGQRVMLLAQLRARFGAVPKAISSRIKVASAAELSRWAKRVLSAPTLDDVLRDP